MSRDDNAPKSAGQVPRIVLLVEDDLIISLDTEMSLIEIGVEAVRTAYNVAQALVSIETDPPDFALLDINLGKETSFEIVRDLSLRGIPFALTSGYSKHTEFPEEIRSAVKISKPYTVDELRAVLTSNSAGPLSTG